jgi:hypothetical protein
MHYDLQILNEDETIFSAAPLATGFDLGNKDRAI